MERKPKISNDVLNNTYELAKAGISDKQYSKEEFQKIYPEVMNIICIKVE